MVLGLGVAVSAAADWRNFGPGGGGWIPSMAVSPHDSRVVFAGCDVGGAFVREE